MPETPLAQIPVHAPAPPAPPTAVAVDPLTAALVDLLPAPPVAAGETLQGKHAAPVTDKANWPCPHCGAQVPISLDSCHSCGAGFLSGATVRASARLPVVGDLRRFSTGERWLFAGVAAVVFTVLLLVVATLSVRIF